MKIAVTYENDTVFQHFGHTQRFKVYNVENGAVQSAAVINTNGTGHGALANLLRQGDIDVLICGGIGAGAQQALTQAGIKWYGGVSGNADQAVKDFIAGKLQYDPQATCNHHGEGHDHGEGHQCGGTCGGNCSQ